MAGLKLSKLPDRTPVKLTINLAPDLFARLNDYAEAYAQIYQAEEPVSELVPAIVAAFLDSDRGFSRVKREVAAAPPKS